VARGGEKRLFVVAELVRARDEDAGIELVRSAVPNYILVEFTAGYVKVVLTGEGTDEIFAGYEYLEEFRTEEDLHAELVRTIEGLHDLNLQRADRVTMAHDLEARVPFLELGIVSLGLALPAGWKLAGEDQPEKQLLRLAFEGWLPDDFLWRKRLNSATARAPPTFCRAAWRRASPRRSSSASYTRSSPRCAPARRSPTTASSPRTSARSSPGTPSVVSPQRSRPSASPASFGVGGRASGDQAPRVGDPSGTVVFSSASGATSLTISRKAWRFEEGSSRRQAATRSSEGLGSRRGLKITSYCR